MENRKKSSCGFVIFYFLFITAIVHLDVHISLSFSSVILISHTIVVLP